MKRVRKVVYCRGGGWDIIDEQKTVLAHAETKSLAAEQCRRLSIIDGAKYEMDPDSQIIDNNLF